MIDDNANPEKDILREQLKARNVMKREMLFFYGVLIIGMIYFLFFSKNGVFEGILFLLFFLGFRTTLVWYQWNFLKRFELKCRYCYKPLARPTNFLFSPNHDCPHCGQEALASIEKLVEFEKSGKI
jgi:hypothetical protein